ncbi:MAG: YIP1 family protein [Lachnospiraceae bacterium]|jgi:hypothetical protein|uniref:Yip1 family protein n=1 Tax=uncultured Acetatifactor sp. TaxID=1671927 RepID=UPI002618D474|nr:Yip1 family protein [uncultured Acetatifactor sp.]MCI8787985.1 YIP1 family protein [Lachnospiraceae bacterium]
MLYGEKIKTGLEKVKYCFYVMTHPFDGFWGIRREGKGSIPVAIAFVLLTILTLTIEKQSTGFLFNHNRLSELNVLVDIITVAMVYVLWCVANWCTTSLMEGKGRMQDILTAVGYSLLPIILIRLPMVLMSHAITTNEGSFYYVLGTISYLWAGFLIFTGTMVIHQYSVGKTVTTCIVTIVGMGIIMFIGLLFFNVIQQMMTFATTIYKELRFR